MRTADRIELLRRLADQLSSDEYLFEDAELVLRQFGLPTGYYHSFDGSRRGYVLNELEDAPDETLVELDEYLLGGASREMLEPGDLPWAPGQYRLFISHTSGNAALAAGVRDVFQRWRIDAFVAHTTIEPTREWERVIEAALSSCDALAVFVSDDMLDSRWCDQEVGYCLARRIPIVPVRLSADPHGFIAKYQAVTPSQTGAGWLADAVFRSLLRHPVAQRSMAAPVVHRYAATTNFDGARINFQLLRDIPEGAWTADLVEVVERAPAHNNQIEHAVVLDEPYAGPMPDAARALLEPIRERLGMNTVTPVPEDDGIPF